MGRREGALPTPARARFALRQAKLAKAGLQVVRKALEENRPLEALHTATQEMDRLEEELESIEEIEAAKEKVGG